MFNRKVPGSSRLDPQSRRYAEPLPFTGLFQSWMERTFLTPMFFFEILFPFNPLTSFTLSGYQ